MEAGYPEVFDDVVTFVRGLGDQPSSSTLDADTDYAAVVMQTVEDILAHAANQPLHEVSEISTYFS